MPFTTNWINNIWKLLQAFYLSQSRLEGARRKVSRLLFEDVYENAEDFSEHRTELVDRVVLPFLERVLLDEKEDDLFSRSLAVLVSAAVAETRDRHEDWRRLRASKTDDELDEEDLAALPVQEIKDLSKKGSFPVIRALITKIATQTACKDDSSGQLGRSTSIKASGKGRDAAASLRGLMSPSKELEAVPSLPSQETEPPPIVPTHQPHVECKSIRAVTSLIAIFSRLAFGSCYSSHSSKALRTPSSMRSLMIYRDLLSLLYPMTDDQLRATSAPINVPARCLKARIVILQWLCRLRADSRHRIYLRADIDGPVFSFAALLKRTKESEAEGRGEVDDAKGRGGRRSEANDERGRAPTIKDVTTRSRSRSRQATVLRGAKASYNPLWRIPEVLDFEMAPDHQTSENITTYEPNHPSLKIRNSPLVESVWLPVSEYVRALNGILRGHDWELVSYVLCFLPLQLSNKPFFHGGRATKELRALLDVLSSGVLGNGIGPSWEKRFHHPSHIRKIDINAAAYQSLSVLISYRGVFTTVECERLVQAFIAGLQGKGEVAKPCLQALTLSIYELPTHIGRHLTEIIDSMKNILSTTGLAVHILEFLLALGQNGTLYRNFTEDQYRLVFVVAINYIAEHNARSDQTVDLTFQTSRESFTLSQHVIGLAYYAIYIWFMALKLPQRGNLVPEIARELLSSRSQRVLVDEMAEVCFDWISRYTYGNADPKPATSFLSDIVMQDGLQGAGVKSQSWLLGGGIVTITSQARTGWATITKTTPTGATSVVTKLENVPFLDLGEDIADLMSLPAFLMANRPLSQDVDALVSLSNTNSSPFAYRFIRMPKRSLPQSPTFQRPKLSTPTRNKASSGPARRHLSAAKTWSSSRATLRFNSYRHIRLLAWMLPWVGSSRTRRSTSVSFEGCRILRSSTRLRSPSCTLDPDN